MIVNHDSMSIHYSI